MLAYAYQTLNEAEFRSVQAEEFENIHDLLSAILIRGVSQQIKRGLQRDYLGQTEALSSLRGKIDISESVRQQTEITKRMICQYDVFSEDTLLNKILKTTMILLLQHGNLKRENRQALRKLLLYFADVHTLNPQHVRWNAVSYHRNNASYRLLINICQLVIKGLLPTNTAGEYRLAEYLDDQQMHRLYEKFVLGYFQREYPQYSAGANYIDWNIDNGVRDLLPVMKSDVTLTYGDKTLIIDTKYYGRTMQNNYDSYSIISGNLYQIFTYVKNKDCTGSGNVSGLLLYAKTDEAITPDNDYLIGGNRISVKTLDLGLEWCEIERQLTAIAALID